MSELQNYINKILKEYEDNLIKLKSTNIYFFTNTLDIQLENSLITQKDFILPQIKSRPPLVDNSPNKAKCIILLLFKKIIKKFLNIYKN